MKASQAGRAGENASLRDIGERELIHRLCDGLHPGPDVVIGPGDDCAVARPAGSMEWDWLLKSDPVIEGVHFTAADDPAAVGRKALGRVFSDIAAMGGVPLWININLAAPPDTLYSRIQALYAGIRDMADRHHAAITGGDVSSAVQLALNVFGVGRVPRGRAVLRSGAHIGDVICATGELGGSRTGRHLDFEPRLPEGQWLQAGNWATAMIDLSDGLATDLHHLAHASHVGAELTAESIPIAPAAQRAPGPRTPLEHALFDGEDFELLFTTPADRMMELWRAWTREFDTPCTVIGRITVPGAGIIMRHPDDAATPLPNHGHEHYGSNG